MTIRSFGLGFLALAGCMFLTTTAGYFIWGFLHGNIPEPILWIRTVEEIYFGCLSLLGLAGVILFGRSLFHG